MLTWDEVKSVMDEAMQESPKSFERLLAEYVPQSVLTQMMLDVVRNEVSRGKSFDGAVQATARFMTGFHCGFLLGMKVK
jgi:hypothetical protein